MSASSEQSKAKDINSNRRIGLIQRVVPVYRADFFDRLAHTLPGDLCVFAGRVPSSEEIPAVEHLVHARFALANNLHFFDASSPFYILWQINLMRWLKEWDPQILIIEANPRYLSSIKAIHWMHRRGRPVIGWGLGAPPFRSGNSRLQQMITAGYAGWRSRFLHQLDALIAYSQRGAQEYQRLGIPSERIFVAVNAVTPRPVSPPPKREPTFQGRPIILFVGRLQTRKRLDLLLHACARLQEPIQPELWIVGDGPAKREYETLASRVYPKTRFLGAMYGDDLARCFNQADLFVLPGTGGLAVQQAMAHGLPVIVAEGDGTQDDLIRPDTGWQVPAGDLDALTLVMSEALSDPARLRKMGEEAFKVVLQVANIEVMAQVFLKAIETVFPDVSGGSG